MPGSRWRSASPPDDEPPFGVAGKQGDGLSKDSPEGSHTVEAGSWNMTVLQPQTKEEKPAYIILHPHAKFLEPSVDWPRCQVMQDSDWSDRFPHEPRSPKDHVITSILNSGSELPETMLCCICMPFN